MRLRERLIPKALVTRVYLLYLITLLLFVGSGVALFYRYQFNQQIEDAQQSSVMLAEVATLVISESAVIGDYDTIRRTLDKVLVRSQFASAQFIDLQGGIIRIDTPQNAKKYAPGWLNAKIEDELLDINRNIVVGGRDYGILRLRFATENIAADIWHMTLSALALAVGALLGGLLLIWFPLKRWLGTLNRLRSTEQTDQPKPGTSPREIIDDVPLEFRQLFEMLAETSENLTQELAQREKAMNSLRALLEKLAPDFAAPAGDAHGDLEAITQMLSDLLAERERSRRALDNQKFALDQHAIVSITDTHGRIVYANEKFCTSSGYPLSELVGQTHRLVSSGIHPQDFYKDLWHTIQSGRVWRGELCNRSRNGSLLWYSSTIVPLLGTDGLIQQYIGLSTDITRRKAAEAEADAARLQAEQANRAKSEFLANMSHEIRTPMNGILGMTALALDTELTHEQRDYLSIVKSSSESLLTIINDILDFSKIEAGKLDIEQIAFDLPSLVNETLRTLKVRAGEKNLELRTLLATGLPNYVIGDPGRLRQVLINLIGNALKFTEQGHVQLSLQQESDNSGDWLHFAVTDTGIGIAPEKQANIFEAFVQEDASTSRRYGGTGLGLSISSRLIALMGGRMWLQSTLGQGSTFFFILPCRIASADSNTSSLPAEKPQTPSDETPPKLLLVEDNPVNQRLALALLQKRGYPVTVAVNGEEAVSHYLQGEQQIILMDVQMPIMDGLEATRRIRMLEAERGSTRIPIIAMTANAMQGDREVCLAAGMDDYISKPIRAEELYKALAKALTQ